MSKSIWSRSTLLIYVSLFGCLVAKAEVHIVNVADHRFESAVGGRSEIQIKEGDSVKWVWKNDYHNVVAGSLNQPLNAFQSEVLNTGDVFEIIFDRNLLRNFPMPDNTYQYFCEPHAQMGMTGSVHVERVAKQFEAKLKGWQALPPNSSLAKGDCSVVLSADESKVDINCAHTLATTVTLELRSGAIGTEGARLCLVGQGSSECQLRSENVDALYRGELFLLASSNLYPSGELRGQIVRTGGAHTILGTVLDSTQQALAGVHITNGETTAISDGDGNYILENVLNGVYRLRASKREYTLLAETGVNPVLVSDTDAYFRDFRAYLRLPAKKSRKQLRRALKILKDKPTRHDLRQARQHLRRVTSLGHPDTPNITRENIEATQMVIDSVLEKPRISQKLITKLRRLIKRMLRLDSRS